MGRCYDNWERLVEAVIRREQNRCLCLAHSFSTSDFSYASTSQYSSSNLSVRTIPIPLHTDVAKEGNKQILAKTKTALLKSLSIFGGFSSKKNNSIKEREVKMGMAQRQIGFPTKQKYELVRLTTEIAKMGAEDERLRELHTLKGHIESLVKKKGVDLDSIHHGYTV